MDVKLLNIGFGNVVFSHRIIAIVGPESAPIKRLVQDAKDRGRLIDGTYGRRNPCRAHYRQRPYHSFRNSTRHCGASTHQQRFGKLQ